MASNDDKQFSVTAEPGYLQHVMSEYLIPSTDMRLVVEGTALPCHKDVLALHSKVFAGMIELTANTAHGAYDVIVI